MKYTQTCVVVPVSCRTLRNNKDLEHLLSYKDKECNVAQQGQDALEKQKLPVDVWDDN